MATSTAAPGTHEARYLARVSGSHYAELQRETELRSGIERNVARIKELFTHAVRESAPGPVVDSCLKVDRCVDALFGILSTVGRADTDRTTAQDAFRGTAVAGSTLDDILELHLRSRARVNRWFAENGGWPVSSDVYGGNPDALHALRAILAMGARFVDVSATLPSGTREELEQSAIKPGHALLNNRVHEDHILSVNHQGRLESQMLGQPPMFELIMSEAPKLTVEVAVLKAHTSVQRRAGVPLEILQLVAFAFCHEVYPALATWEPSSAPGEYANWLDFVARNSEVEQIKIARTSVVNELYNWYRPWAGSGAPTTEYESVTHEEKQQLLWGIPNITNTLRFLGMLNLALDVCSLHATTKPEGPLPERLPADGHEFYVPMGVYEKIKRKSQDLKREQLQLSAGDRFINMMFRKRPKTKKRLLWQTWVGYGAQDSPEQKLANQRAFDEMEAATTRLLAGLGLELESAATDSIYSVLLNDVVGKCRHCVSPQGLVAAVQAPDELVARFLDEINGPIAHFAECEPLAGLKRLLL